MNIRDPRTYAIIGAAMEVHNQLGNGFLEAVYQDALEIELTARSIPNQREVNLPITYKGHTLKTFYRADFICYDAVIVELKAIKSVTNIEESQIINYLNATGFEVGLILNFGARTLEHPRFVNSRKKSAQSASSAVNNRREIS